ncbi:MAG: hypothetical protein Q9207_007713, partial [Kuettlingeria erythrocarpa]
MYPKRAGRRARASQSSKHAGDVQEMMRTKKKRKVEEETESEAKRAKSAPTEDDDSHLTQAGYPYGEAGLAEQADSLVESYLQDSSAYLGYDSVHRSFDFAGDDVFGGLVLPPSGPSPEP